MQDQPIQTTPTRGPFRTRQVGLCLALLFASLTSLHALAAGNGAQPSGLAPSSGKSSGSAMASGAPDLVPGHSKRATLGQERASAEAIHIADWVVDSRDNRGMPFMIVDKVQARVMMFDADGRLQGAAPALLGLARGDDSVAGIGERKLSSIRPEERTTPAGRFVASLAPDIHGQEMLWVDYDAAISLHRVVKGSPGERRAQRLDSPTPDDNRISYGCINVPVRFYDKLVSPAFTATDGVVYILPETRSAREVFGSYDVQDRALQMARQQTAAPAESAAASRK